MAIKISLRNSFKDGVFTSLKITLVFTIVFTLFNQDFSFLAIAHNLLISAMLSKKGGDNINHSAHIWGALYGVIFLIL